MRNAFVLQSNRFVFFALFVSTEILINFEILINLSYKQSFFFDRFFRSIYLFNFFKNDLFESKYDDLTSNRLSHVDSEIFFIQYVSQNLIVELSNVRNIMIKHFDEIVAKKLVALNEKEKQEREQVRQDKQKTKKKNQFKYDQYKFAFDKTSNFRRLIFVIISNLFIVFFNVKKQSKVRNSLNVVEILRFSEDFTQNEIINHLLKKFNLIDEFDVHFVNIQDEQNDEFIVQFNRINKRINHVEKRFDEVVQQLKKLIIMQNEDRKKRQREKLYADFKLSKINKFNKRFLINRFNFDAVRS